VPSLGSIAMDPDGRTLYVRYLRPRLRFRGNYLSDQLV